MNKMEEAKKLNGDHLAYSIDVLKSGWDKDAWKLFCESLDNLKDLMKIEKYYIPEMHEKDCETGEYVESKIEKMKHLYHEYSEAKKDYQISHRTEDKDRMIKYLEQLMGSHDKVMADLWSCVDCVEEKEYIQKKIMNLKSKIA